MSQNNSFVNESIMKIMNTLEPKLHYGKLIDMDTPIKRPASEASNEDSTPAKRHKINPKHDDVFYIGSPREVRRIHADLLDARNQIVILEKRISHMHTIRKEMEILFDHESQGLKVQCEKDRKTIEELEGQLQGIRKREEGLKLNLDEVTNELKVYKAANDEKLRVLEKNVSSLSIELQENSSDGKTERVALKRKITELETIYNSAKEETEAHKKLIDELTKRLNEKAGIEAELELKAQALKKTQLQIKELEFNRESYLEFQQQAKSQQHKLSTYSDLERENQRLKEETKNLKDEVHNKLVLEEEVHNLKQCLINLKEQEKKYQSLQVQNSQTELYLEEFRTLARNICETSTNDAGLPRALRNIVERLQQQEINLTSEKIQLESKLSTATHESKIARDELQKSQSHITDIQTNFKNQKNLIHRIQKKLMLVSGERDSYRKQLDSYEKDLTICVNPGSSPYAAAAQAQLERVQSLEKVVDEYRDMVTKLEADLARAEPSLHADVIPVKAEQLTRLQEELEKVKNENVQLRERKDNLEVQLEELLVGQDRVEGRILHNVQNPLNECLQQREKETEKLKEENEKLKRKIRKLEAGLEASKLEMSTTIDAKEVSALKEKLTSTEQRLQRYKESFQNSMQEFRNVIYMLLGYRVDRTSTSIYTLTSMYAEKSQDQLVFKLNKEGALNLLENEFSISLEEMVELHCRHQKSIPVFLSALTMELFNNGTMTKTYDVDEDSDDDDDDS